MYRRTEKEVGPTVGLPKPDHPLTMTNMSAKFDEEAQNGLVSIMFKSLLSSMYILTLNLWPKIK